MITPLSAVQTFLRDIDDPIAIDSLHKTVEAWCKLYCDNDFEDGTFASLLNGKGRNQLKLPHKPITALIQVSIGRVQGIKVKNTAADVTNAYVSVSSTSVTCVVLGGTSAGSNAIAFADHDNLTKMVAAIVALGNNWTAALVNVNYGDILSTQLIPCEGRYCGGRGNTTAPYTYLEIPDTPRTDTEYDRDSGLLFLKSGSFPVGVKNIYVSYVGGYTAETMPPDLETSIQIGVKHLYDKRSEDGWSLTNIDVAHITGAYVDLLPPEVLSIWNHYGGKRVIM